MLVSPRKENLTSREETCTSTSFLEHIPKETAIRQSINEKALVDKDYEGTPTNNRNEE